MTDQQQVERAARGLTEAQREEDLLSIWDAFCDADPLPLNRDVDAYLRDVEGDGLVSWRRVEPDDLEDPFAAERGIEPEGAIWCLTPLGLAVRAHLQGGRDGE